jgi:hypothetical protein
MRKITGGIDSVVRVQIPVGMRDGGNAEQLLAEGPPTQFKLKDEESIIPSEPNVLIKPNRETGSIFRVPDPSFGPIPSEPELSEEPGQYGFLKGDKGKDVMIMGPVIDPREVYPTDPDPGIQFNPMMQQQNGGISGLINASMTKPNGILSIQKVYDI